MLQKIVTDRACIFSASFSFCLKPIINIIILFVQTDFAMSPQVFALPFDMRSRESEMQQMQVNCHFLHIKCTTKHFMCVFFSPFFLFHSIEGNRKKEPKTIYRLIGIQGK